MQISNLSEESLETLKVTGRARYQCEDGKYIFIKDKKYQPVRAIEQAFEGHFDEVMEYQYRSGITVVRRDSDWFFISYEGVPIDGLGLFRDVERVNECGGNFVSYGDPKINKGVKIINPSSGKVIFMSSREYGKVKLISNQITEKDMFMIKAFWLDSWGIVDTEDHVRAVFKYTERGIDKVSHQALKERWGEDRIDADITYREMEAERHSKQEAETVLFIMGIEYGVRETKGKKAQKHLLC